MLFADIDLLDGDGGIRRGCWVGTEGAHITYLEEVPPAPEARAAFGEAVDGSGRLLMPGLYNAHAHAPMTLLRGYAEGLPLQEWLFNRVFPFEARMTPEDNYWATLLACAEMARFGTVGFSDMYYCTDERVQAVTEAGIKANICESEMYPDEKPFAEYASFERCEEYARRYHGAAGGRILIDYNIHAEYTSNPQTCADIAAVAKAKGLRMQLHASETRREHEECKARRGGMTPLAYFEGLGVLDVPVTAAHCVWCEPSDVEILREHKVSVACCPASNMKLGSGFAPIPAMLARGVDVCLGTDGAASNNSHNMFQDLYLMALAYKGCGLDPSAVSPAQAIAAATRNGALSQGRADCGLVRAGMRADLVLLDTAGPSWCPGTDLAGNAVYAGCGADVLMTVCDGRAVYREGTWPGLDVERIKAEVSARTKRIISEL